MATALELTRPEHAERFDVTVYQLGWRLGGKGASGRGPDGRIEEHGLHLWMGWYENAFRILRECYDELGRDWQAAFHPAPLVAVTDRLADGTWQPWARVFPPTEGLPGDPVAAPMRWTVAEYMKRAAALLRALIESLGQAGGVPGGTVPAAADREDPWGALGRFARAGQVATLTGMVQAASLLELALGTSRGDPPGVLMRVLDTIGTSAARMLEAHLADDPEMRRIWEVMDLTLATIRGNIRFGLMTDPRGFDAIDEYDCREWLALNGASARALDSAYLRSLYDLGFAYEHGDPTRPRVAAGQALRGFLRAFFTYRGAFFWKMNAGMGDVVFAPMYEVLRRRGVRFEFFHRLRDVGIAEPTADDGAHVDRLEFDVQARVAGGAPYAPLVDVGGLPCWPSAPDWTQLDDGEQLQREGRRFECHWDERRAGTRTLRVGDDFDFVVLAVGLGAIPYVCRSLVARDPRWREMVEHVRTVPTQAFQLWLRADAAELGWSGPPITISGFVEPFDTWADMTHLVPREAWREPPKSLAYFCSVLADPLDDDTASAAYPGRLRETVRRNALEFLSQHVRHLWPNAVDANGDFRWDLLIAPNGEPASAGTERFRSQYWTANVNPTDRYTLSLPGSGRYRISPLDVTYDNLTVCGDWTDCGFNAGCVEAATMSGRLAAHALSGLPALADIVGYDHP